MNRIAPLFAFLIGLAISSTTEAQALLNPPPPKTATEIEMEKLDLLQDVLAKAQEFSNKAEWQNYADAMKRALALRPYASRLRIELSAAYALQDKKSEAYEALLALQSTGYAFDPAADKRFEKIRGTDVWDYLVEGFKNNAKQQGAGKVAFTLSQDDLLLEALAYDAGKAAFLAGSVRTGKIYRVKADGKLDPFIKPDSENGLFGVFDMVAVPAQNALWVVSSSIPHVKHAPTTTYGQGGLWKFQLDTGKFLGKWLLPDDGLNHLLSAVAADDEGHVFIADRMAALIWKLEGNALRLVVRNPKLASIRGLAISTDKSILYFNDFEQGVFGLELASGKFFWIAGGKKSTLFGIESLYVRDDKTLIAVQTGIQPRRTIALQLSDDRRKVLQVLPLDSNNPALTAPTRGTLVGDGFYVIANSQKGKYDGEGRLLPGSKLEPIRIFQSPIRTLQSLTNTDMAR